MFHSYMVSSIDTEILLHFASLQDSISSLKKALSDLTREKAKREQAYLADKKALVV